MKINILGVEYDLQLNANPDEDDNLIEGDGYIDYQTQIIVVSEFEEGVPGETKDIKRYENHVIRHELVHAFLYESGLANYASDELLVDWLAIQLPKMTKLMNEIDVM